MFSIRVMITRVFVVSMALVTSMRQEVARISDAHAKMVGVVSTVLHHQVQPQVLILANRIPAKTEVLAFLPDRYTLAPVDRHTLAAIAPLVETFDHTAISNSNALFVQQCAHLRLILYWML